MNFLKILPSLSECHLSNLKINHMHFPFCKKKTKNKKKQKNKLRSKNQFPLTRKNKAVLTAAFFKHTNIRQLETTYNFAGNFHF